MQGTVKMLSLSIHKFQQIMFSTKETISPQNIECRIRELLTSLPKEKSLKCGKLRTSYLQYFICVHFQSKITMCLVFYLCSKFTTCLVFYSYSFPNTRWLFWSVKHNIYFRSRRQSRIVEISGSLQFQVYGKSFLKDPSAFHELVLTLHSVRLMSASGSANNLFLTAL